MRGSALPTASTLRCACTTSCSPGPTPDAIPEGGDYKDYLNPESVVACTGCKSWKSLKDAKPGDKFQFVRTGFFTPDSKNPGVYNRVVTLRDSFKPAK